MKRPSSLVTLVLPWLAWTVALAQEAKDVGLDRPDAQAASAPREKAEAPPAQGLGQLVIRDAQSGAARRLEVARYYVQVVLQPPVALVQIDQSFYNHYARQEEGEFVFNLPLGASVSRFAMYVTPTQLIEGELIERQQAANIYQSIVNRQRDPAILEQIGDSLFRMRVFPIPSQDTKRILLDYTLPLEETDGRYRFQLPLFSDLRPIWDFRLTGSILGPTSPQSISSRSHPDLKFEPAADGKVRFELRDHFYQPKTDFVLEFTAPGAGRLRGTPGRHGPGETLRGGASKLLTGVWGVVE